MELVNRISDAEFIKLFGNIVEHQPQVAENICSLRPFTSADNMVAELQRQIMSFPTQQKVSLLCNHPDLAGKLADSNLLTPESTREQMDAGLHVLTTQQKTSLTDLNSSYRSKYGFPFVICARENKAASILAGLVKRLDNDVSEEIELAVGEVVKIAALRARDIIASLQSSL